MLFYKSIDVRGKRKEKLVSTLAQPLDCKVDVNKNNNLPIYFI